MKTNSDMWQVTGDRKKCVTPSCHVSRVTCHSQQGVALVITLILLAVVTIMAVTFLAITRRERGAVATVTDTASAKLAADAALAAAEAQIIANALATTNPYNFGLLVSTNYINPYGFQPGVANPTNVNYDYRSDNKPFTPNDDLQNIANLFYSPRPPVFITNRLTGLNEFRFYLDLNRNGRYDRSGPMLETNALGFPTGNIVTNVGDPEWVGILERPDAPHGPNSKFVARYAFIAVPIGNALDLNAIHNQALIPVRNYPANPMDLLNDGYFRNQGVGSWEINLAAFLADLNTNRWAPFVLPDNGYYAYYQPSSGNRGVAFEDAFALLTNRYAGNYNLLATVQNLYALPGQLAFQNDIDGYSGGPLMTNLWGTNLYSPNVTWSWAGADNTNHFFTHQELFDPAKTSVAFTNHLLSAGISNATYNRYTFYRLLAQLGTDSAPESGKMNINYDNLDLFVTNGFGGFITNPPASTNFMAWQPLTFFTNAVDRLLRAYTTQWRNSNPTNFAKEFYGVTNFNFINADQWTNYPAFGLSGASGVIPGIPVLVNNRFVYSSAVNRLLQLAANIYDATTNRYYDSTLTPLPTVFQPLFTKVADVFNATTNVYITSFVEVVNTNFLSNTNFMLTSSTVGNLQSNYLVFGVPLIIGAKKGFPNFNEFALQSAFQLTRKLEFTRANSNSPSSSYQLNQMFNLSISNQIGVECWNSYLGNYTRPVDIYANDYLSVTLTNDENFGTNLAWYLSGHIPINLFDPTNKFWPGYNLTGNPLAAPYSFQIPLNTDLTVVTNSTYHFNVVGGMLAGPPYLVTPPATNYETNVVINGSKYPQPHWLLATTNNLQVFMVDAASGRIIDYVQLSGPNSFRDLTSEITNNEDSYPYTGINGLWEMGRDNQGVPIGINNQIGVSLGIYTSGSDWDTTDPIQIEREIDGFRVFYQLSPTFFPNGNYGIDATTNAHQIPYTPTATAVQHISWQANDPLVHYLASDLTRPAIRNSLDRNRDWPANIGQLNDNYFPWGGNPLMAGADLNSNNIAVKDPLVYRSDYWDFPTNKFPTVGWLGRVHRGTPWQTVYLKATNIVANLNNLNIWTAWTGNADPTNAFYTAPVQDRLLFDVFTTAFNDNATRGTLSVNQSGLAAWSALFSGIVVPTSLTNTYTIIQPAGPAGAPVPVGPPGLNSPLGYLVQNGTNGINDIRANTNLFPQQVFQHVGDILAVPALTEKSPFLPVINATNVNDEMVEWLPQQVMSLLRCSSSPRYVIYSYGQALKPVQNAIVTSGPLFGMFTNYQVVAEIGTRAVVRFDSMLTNVVARTNDAFGNPSWYSVPVVTNNRVVIESFNLLPPD
jgi:hypothetical protein